MLVDECFLHELKRITDTRGSLSVVESNFDIPFEIKRVFYIYDVPTSEGRGAHAHKSLHQFVVCLSGSFDIELNDTQSKRTVHLNRPWQGLHIPPMIWAAERNFDPGSVCLVICSDVYKEEDYYRDYESYRQAYEDLRSSKERV